MNKSIINLGIISLGCPKNTADTENVLSHISNSLGKGFMLSSPENAQIILINTCGFLKAARDEVFDNIEEFKNRKIIIIGCLAGNFKPSDLKKYPQLFAVVTELNYKKLPEIIEKVSRNEKVYEVAKEPLKFIKTFGKSLITPRSYAYIKIAEGCNNKCTYCLIPKLKGQFRSRDMDEILDEAKTLVKAGVKELILVAQDCGYYGMDLKKKTTLASLLQKLEKISGDFWIRVLYVYPERVTDQLLKTIAASKKICRYLDIPLQHGDKDILKSMNRFSIPEKIIEKINKIKKEIPHVALRSSLIVGFPGETDSNFKNLTEFVKKISFDHVGVFEYSREPNTDAYAMPKQVQKAKKSSRRKALMKLQQKISLKNNEQLLGKKIKVLIEKYDDHGKIYFARSQRFAPEIDGVIYIKSSKKLPLNTFQEVEITKAGEYDLVGTI